MIKLDFRGQDTPMRRAHWRVVARRVGRPPTRSQRLDDWFPAQDLRVEVRLEIRIQVAQLGIDVVELVARLDERGLHQGFLDLVVHDYSLIVGDWTGDVARSCATLLRFELPMQLDLRCVETVCGKFCAQDIVLLSYSTSLTPICAPHLLGCDGYAHRLLQQIEKFLLIAAHEQFDPLRALREPPLLQVAESVLGFKTGDTRVQLSHELVGIGCAARRREAQVPPRLTPKTFSIARALYGNVDVLAVERDLLDHLESKRDL